MNAMKKLIILILVLALIGGGYYWWTHRDTSTTSTGTTNTQTNNTKPDPSNATFNIEGDAVTLASGKNESAAAPGSAITEETTLMEKLAYGDLNGDGKNDTALLLARYGGGSGTFIYVAAYVSGTVTYKGSEATFLGDRIAPQSISINNSVITVVYLDRGPDDSFAEEPTIRTTKAFVYKNGSLEEK